MYCLHQLQGDLTPQPNSSIFGRCDVERARWIHLFSSLASVSPRSVHARVQCSLKRPEHSRQNHDGSSRGVVVARQGQADRSCPSQWHQAIHGSSPSVRAWDQDLHGLGNCLAVGKCPRDWQAQYLPTFRLVTESPDMLSISMYVLNSSLHAPTEESWRRRRKAQTKSTALCGSLASRCRRRSWRRSA